MRLKQFIFALTAMLMSFSLSVSAQTTELLVSSDYNSSTEGYGTSKFSNYAGAYAYATANATNATIVIEKTTTLSGNTFDNNHKNYSKLAVVIKDGATMGNALSKWDMTYPVTVEPGGTLTCARPISASVSNIHIKNTLTVGAEGATKKAVVDFLSDTYQDCDISIRYNGKVLVYNADFRVQDLDAQGILTIEDSKVEVDGAFASATFFKTTLTNTEMTVNGNLISGGLSDFAGGDSNQLGNVTINNSTLTIKEGTTKVASTVTAANSTIDVNNLTVNTGKTLNLNEGSTLEAEYITLNGTATVKVDGVAANVKDGVLITPKGNDFTGYTRGDAIWGEVWGNATESFVIKVLDADGNVMGTTSLNNIGGIIDGDVNVTWSLKFDAASNTDEYWTMAWTTAPTIDNMPAKVELWVDGVRVSGGDVVLNAPDNLNKIYAAVTDANGKILSFHTDVQEAIKAAAAVTSVARTATAGTVEFLADVTVDKWIMFAEKMTVSDGSLITLNINGVTIDGNGKTLTVKSIESAGNGGYLFYDAQNLTVKDLTINIADGLVGGIGLQSGTISNVTFNGGQYGVLPGSKGVTISGCTFNDTNGYAVYYENERPGIVVTGNTFNTADGAYAITMRSNEQFTNNTVEKGRVNLANSAASTVTGNNFGTERFKVYNGATATIEDNTINNLVFNDASVVNSTFANNTLSSEAQAALAAAKFAVAKIGDTKYATLAEAVAAAESGATITLMNGEHELPLFSGKELTFVGESKEGVIVNDAPDARAQGWNGSTFHFENLTAKGANANYHGLANGVVAVTYKNCNINGLRFLYATEGVSFEDCAFNAQGVEHSFWTYGASNVTVKNSTFTYTDRAVNCYSENGANHEADITFEGCSFTYAGTNDAPAGAVEINSGSVKSIDLTMNGCTAPEKGAMWFNSQWDSKKGENTVVAVNGEIVWQVLPAAKVNGAEYKSLQAALDAAAAGTGNVTVEILRDVDLTGIDWNPVTVSGPGYPLVTVEGNNKAITGLNDMLFAGTWAGKSGIIIKNLTIADSEIVNDKDDAKGNVGVGAFIGFPQASATITLENCHLKNSRVEGGHWTGGLFGYAAGYAGNDGPVFMNLTVNGCSVTESTIIGKGSVGGIIGHGSGNGWTNVVIENTTVSGNTITSTGSSTNKAGAVMGTIGAAGQPTTVNGVTNTGGASVSATVADNTVTSNGTAITTIYGRQGTPSGLLYVAGGSYDNNPIEENVAYAKPAEGYKIVKNDDNTYGVVVDPAYGKVAMIGDTYYETLDAAFAAAQDNDEVKIIADGTYALTTSGKNITITGAVDGVVFDNIGAKNMGGANVTFNKVTFDYYPNVDYTGLQHSGNLTYNDCIINGQVFLYGQSETFNNCTFNQNSADAYNVWTYGAKEVDFNECTFNSVGKSVLVYTESATTTNDVAFTNCELNASAPVDGKAAIEIDTSLSAGATITVDDATTATGFANGNVSGNSLWNNKKGNADAANNDVTIVVNGETVLAPIPDVAMIDETGYRTLAEAIAAAQPGETVKVFAGTYPVPAMKAGIIVEGAVNADGTPAVLLEGTLSGTLEDLTLKNLHIKGGNAQRWAYAKGDLVFENVTFEATSVYAIHFDGITEGTNLLYKGCTIIGWAAMGGSPASCVFDSCTIKDNGTYGVIRTYFNTTIENCTFDVANANTGDVYQDGIHAVDGAEIVVDSCTNANGEMKDLVNVSGASVVTVDGVEFKNVAKIGDKYYATINEAIAAAQPGDIVTILAGDYAQNINVNKAITLQGATSDVSTLAAGATDTNLVNIAGKLSISADGATVKNINVNNGSETAGVINAKNVTVEGCKVVGGNGFRYCYTSGTVTFRNSVITGSTYGIHFDGSAGGNIVIDNCTITGWTSFASTITNVALKDTKFEEGNYNQLRFYQNATLEGCTFNEKMNIDFGKNETTAEFKNCTVENGGKLTDVIYLADIVNMGIDVTVDDEPLLVAATIGEACYLTLAEAVATAQSGETITLLADIEATEVILLDKSVTINGNGHKVTSNATRVFRVTTANTEVTLNDVKMVSTAVRVGTNDVRGISIDIVDNVKLTLNNCSVDFTDASANDWAYAVNVTGGNNHVVTVNGGAYEGANVINVRGANNTVTVKNAVITCTYPNNPLYYGACIWVLQNQGSSVEATGNTFNGSNAIAFNLGTGTNLTESDNTDNTEYVVAMIGDAYYTSIQAAIAAAENGATITVIKDFAIDEMVTVAAGKELTIDLNGKTITGTDNTSKNFSIIDNRGNLTIKDSSAEKSGKITLTATIDSDWNRYSAVIANNPGGKLTIDGGTLEHLGGTDMAYGIDNLTNGKGTYAETVINDGTIKSTYRGIRQFLNGIEAHNILTINGGTVEGANKSVWMQDPNKNANTGALTVGENAKLVGDVYLYVTPESTSWPVEVSIAIAALQGEVITANVPAGYELAKINNTYCVALASDLYASVNGIGYRTLAEAITAAQSGDVITFLQDITENVTVAKNVTIDGAGKNYTGTISISGSSNTIKDINFVGTADLYYSLAVRSAKTLIIEDCTVKNYKSGFLYVPKATNIISVKNVTVENCSSYAVYFASGVTTATFENMTVKNSNNGFSIDNSTAKRAFTIKDCTMENVNTAINHSKGTNTITCTALGVNDFGTEVLSQYAVIKGATITGTTYYGSVKGMVETAVTGDTVKLLSDITLDATGYEMATCDGYPSFVHVEGKAITVDLNGKTIDANVVADDVSNFVLGVFSTGNGGELTLVGNSAEGTGTVKLDAAEGKVYSLLCNYEDGCKITINGGTYKATKVIDCLVYSGGKTDALVTVNGGNFTLDNLGQDPNPSNAANGKPWIFNVLGAGDHHILVNGGTFNADINRQHWSNEVYVAKECYTVANADSTAFTVKEGAVAYVNEGMLTGPYFVRKNIGYATLGEAFAAADDDETVTLLKDIKYNKETGFINGEYVDGLVYTGDKNFTVDFAGHTITDENSDINDYLVYLKNTGEKDNVITFKNGTIAIDTLSTATAWAAITVGSNSSTHATTLNLDSMKVINGNPNDANNQVIRSRNGATVNLNEGTTVTSNGTSYGVVAETTATVNINDGAKVVHTNSKTSGGNLVYTAVSGNGTINIYDGAVIESDNYGIHNMTTGNTVINIEGGTIKAPVIVRAATNGGDGQSADVYISGGTFEGAMEEYTNTANIHVSGGVFDRPVAEEFCAEGYAPCDNEDGTYGVYYALLDNFEIIDGDYTEFENLANMTVKGKLTYERELQKVNAWQAFYVPFELPVDKLGDDYDVVYINNMVSKDLNGDAKVDTMYIELIDINYGTLKANYPYLIRAKNEVARSLKIELENNVTLYSTKAESQKTVECSSALTKFEFVGTYNTVTRDGLADKYGSDKAFYGVRTSTGNFAPMSSTAKIAPFRLYMVRTEKDGSPVILDNLMQSIGMRLIGEENEDGTTTIYDVFEDGVGGDNMIYDLNGRRVLDTEKGGIYITNGKKVLVK